MGTQESTGAAWVGTFESLRDYKNIPATTLHDLLTYFVEGRGGGHFVQAVLENSLRAAFDRGDLANLRAMWAIATWLYNRAPQSAQGSPEAVRSWRERGGLKGWYHGADRDAFLSEWIAQAVEGTLLEGMEYPL